MAIEQHKPNHGERRGGREMTEEELLLSQAREGRTEAAQHTETVKKNRESEKVTNDKKLHVEETFLKTAGDLETLKAKKETDDLLQSVKENNTKNFPQDIVGHFENQARVGREEASRGVGELLKRDDNGRRQGMIDRAA